MQWVAVGYPILMICEVVLLKQKLLTVFNKSPLEARNVVGSTSTRSSSRIKSTRALRPRRTLLIDHALHINPFNTTRKTGRRLRFAWMPRD
ncbi:hypothetical protein GCK32_019501 [Trichostrongylus colubriformis]|uniref:Uncharacterized protein n=1 Tax=Trichostrongylus colubriformis TaxID=6319 RepID=A0AAN8FNZ6_TRICO